MDVDIDNDFDGKLLDQFRSMGTTDRDVLIAEFQAVLGNKLNPESCAFFLDMNNWNLQNAVCSYLDFEQPSSSLPSMAIVADVTIGEGEAVAPSTTFCKTWKIKNSGMDRWPPGCHLRFCSGDNMSTLEMRMLDALDPGNTTDVTVEMKSPSIPGSYYSLWRVCSPTGIYFGDVINVHVVVAEGGLLGITQQLSRFGGDLAHPVTTAGNSIAATPFGVDHNASSVADMDAQDNLQQRLPVPSDQTNHQQVVLYSVNPASQGLPAPPVTPVASTNEEDLEMS